MHSLRAYIWREHPAQPAEDMCVCVGGGGQNVDVLGMAAEGQGRLQGWRRVTEGGCDVWLRTVLLDPGQLALVLPQLSFCHSLDGPPFCPTAGAAGGWGGARSHGSWGSACQNMLSCPS